MDEISITPADLAVMNEQLLEENARLRKDSLAAHTVLRRLHDEVGQLREIVAYVTQEGARMAAEQAAAPAQAAAPVESEGSPAPEAPELPQVATAGEWATVERALPPIGTLPRSLDC